MTEQLTPEQWEAARRLALEPKPDLTAGDNRGVAFEFGRTTTPPTQQEAHQKRVADADREWRAVRDRVHDWPPHLAEAELRRCADLWGGEPGRSVAEGLASRVTLIPAQDVDEDAVSTTAVALVEQLIRRHG